MGQPAIFFLVIAAPAFSLCLALLGLETLGANRLGWFLLALGIIVAAVCPSGGETAGIGCPGGRKAGEGVRARAIGLRRRSV